MLKFCIIDDNFRTLYKLTSMLESIFIKNDFDAEISFKTTSPKDLISFIDSNNIDVLILDIDLHSDISGLDIAKKIRSINKNCYIIFTTAHLEYGIVAYKFKTFDFLSKPITVKRIEETIIRLFDDIKGIKKKFIKLDNKNTIIEENEIKFIKRDGMKIVFHTDNRDYQIYSSFAKIQNRLSSNFIRCHKSFIVNLNNIKQIEPISNMVFFNDSHCDIGPKYKNKFLEVVTNYANIK